VQWVVSAGSGEAGLFAVGQLSTGFIAIGQEATGVIAIGQEATGIIAIGQLARGFVAVGQVALGIVSVGMVAGGVLWCAAGLGVSAFAGPWWVVYPLLGRPRSRQWPRRLLAWARREPWDTPPRGGPLWRRALGIAVLAGLVVLWWSLAGQPALSAVFNPTQPQWLPGR
jgi:hypothetical protein